MTIRKAITVARPPEVAFRVFTEEIGRWWPLREGFSFGRERAQDLIIEARVGGRFFERFNDGTEFEVGRVTAFQPPHLVSLTWKAPDWEGPTDIEVRFVAEGSGTRVELEHRGWEQGPKMEGVGKSYDGGWEIILARYSSRMAEAR
jgi:uncharacterized protein YndB with AHSA1/START domain